MIEIRQDLPNWKTLLYWVCGIHNSIIEAHQNLLAEPEDSDLIKQYQKSMVITDHKEEVDAGGGEGIVSPIKLNRVGMRNHETGVNGVSDKGYL